jgi:hypothetical protein
MPNNLGRFSEILTKLATAAPKELNYIEQIL